MTKERPYVFRSSLGAIWTPQDWHVFHRHQICRTARGWKHPLLRNEMKVFTFASLHALALPLPPACLTSFTDLCLVHRQQSREQKKIFACPSSFTDVHSAQTAVPQEKKLRSEMKVAKADVQETFENSLKFPGEVNRQK